MRSWYDPRAESTAPGRRRKCRDFLRWALPQLGYALPGFRRVQRQVCKRLGRRLQELRLPDFDAYRSRLENDPAEWRVLDGFCWIPISRFARDWLVFECIGHTVLPMLCQTAAARGNDRISCWSVGCARGEEPYTLAALWHFVVAPAWPGLLISILATDIDGDQIERAKAGLFKESSLKELPHDWRDRMFEATVGSFRIKPIFREAVRFVEQDIRVTTPSETFDLILCRNLVLTYFADPQKRHVLDCLIDRLRPGGFLVIGAHERITADLSYIEPWLAEQGIYRRASRPGDPSSRMR